MLLRKSIGCEVVILIIILPASPTTNGDTWRHDQGKDKGLVASRMDVPVAGRMDIPVAARMQSGSSLSIFIDGSVVETDMANPSGSYNMPYFDLTAQTNFSHEVSWIRKTDSAILTVDDQKFYSDKRIQIKKIKESSLWELQIRELTASDSGVYECQISSEPKLSRFARLNITVPELWIDGAPEILAKTGSKLTLKCLVKGSKINRNITWSVTYENGTDVQLETEIIKMNTGVHKMISINDKDVGEYRCESPGIKTVHVKLHISPGLTLQNFPVWFRNRSD